MRIVEVIRFSISPIDLTLSFSIRAFLPLRSQYCFYFPAQQLLERHALPPSDPDALHPALLSVVHLSGCSAIGGSLLTHIRYLQRRTRELLHQSLAFADRLAHFLWAAITFFAWLGRSGFFKESAVTAISTTRFALACGLVSHDEGPGVLHPPTTVEEAVDRTHVNADPIVHVFG